MTKTSKIKAIRGDGHWDSPHGTLYKFEYEFEDGQLINAKHKKSESPFNVGDTVEYEITDTKWNNGKVRRIQEQKKSFDTKGIEVGHAINNAVNMLCAGVEFDNVDNNLPTGQKIVQYARNIMQIAEKLKSE